MEHLFESDRLPVAEEGILLQGLMRPALYSGLLCGDNAGEHVMCSGSLRM